MSEELLKTIETGDELLKIYGDDFQRDMLFVIEIFAAWCGPSQAALSTYRKIKDSNEQKKFKLCKVCADVYEQLDEKGQGFFDLGKFSINPRPTFVLFKDGEQVGLVEGVSMPTLEKCAHAPRPGDAATPAPCTRARHGRAPIALIFFSRGCVCLQAHR